MSGGKLARSVRQAVRQAVGLVLTVVLVACSTSKQEPIPFNQQQAQAPDPNGKVVSNSSFNSTSSDSVNIQNRTPDTEQRKRARLRMELAVNYYQDGKYAFALDELKQALTIDPTFADAHGVLALVYMELGEKTLAEQSFQRALQFAPESSDINNNYGWFLCQSGRPAQSIPYFLAAIKSPLYPEPANPLQNAGVCSMRMGDRSAAETYFRRSFELNPSGVVSAFNLAIIYFDRKDMERARFYANLVNKTPAANSESLWLGIKIEHILGNSPEELSLATQLQRAFPTSREAEMLARHAYNE